MGADAKTVDVLAVLKRITKEAEVALLDGAGIQEGDSVPPELADKIVALWKVADAARAAIAELIERERVMRAALEQAVTSMQDSGYSNDHIAVRAARAVLRACGSTPSYPTPSQSVGNAASVEGGA